MYNFFCSGDGEEEFANDAINDANIVIDANAIEEAVKEGVYSTTADDGEGETESTVATVDNSSIKDNEFDANSRLPETSTIEPKVINMKVYSMHNS